MSEQTPGIAADPGARRPASGTAPGQEAAAADPPAGESARPGRRTRRPVREVLVGDFPRLQEIVSRYYLMVTLVVRLPSIILPLTVLTYVAVASGNELQGAASAAAALLGQGLSVLLLLAVPGARGRQWLLLLQTAVHVGAIWLLVYRLADQAGLAPSDPWPWYLALLAGLSAPQLGNASRLRWRAILETHRRPDLIQASMRHDAVMDALAIVLGAMITGLVAITVGPLVGIMASAGLLGLSSAALLLHPTADLRAQAMIPDPEAGRPMNRAMRRRRRRQQEIRFLPVLGGGCIGLLIGSIQMCLVYFAAAVDAVASIGVQFASLGLLSAVSAMLAAGWAPRRPWNMWIIFGALTVVSTLLMSVPSRPAGMVLMLAVMGAAIGPTLVAVFGIVPLITPLRDASVISSITTVLIHCGMGAGVLLAGVVGDQAGYETAVLIPALSAALLLITAFAFTARRGRVPLGTPLQIQAEASGIRSLAGHAAAAGHQSPGSSPDGS